MRPNLEQSVANGVQFALGVIRSNYDLPRDITQRLYYHNSQHTIEVLEKTDKLLLVANQYSQTRVQPDHFLITRLAAAFHDIDQAWDPMAKVESGMEAIKRIRRTGIIEESSAQQAIDFMRGVSNSGSNLLTPELEELVRRCIMITVPTFDNQLMTIRQANFTNDAPLEARIIALADLGVP